MCDTLRNTRLFQSFVIACVLLLAACSNNNDGLFVDLSPPREPIPGVVFTGDVLTRIHAWDADTGEELWSS